MMALEEMDDKKTGAKKLNSTQNGVKIDIYIDEARDDKEEAEEVFELKLLSSQGTELPRSQYIPLSNTWYDVKSLDMCIKASFRRYDINPKGSSYFFVESPNNPRDISAIVCAIEIGGQYSCVSDYFKDASSLRGSSSPVTGRTAMVKAATLWDELKDYFEKNEKIKVRILFPYTVHTSSWVVGEIEIQKVKNEYQLVFAMHDPSGYLTLQPSDLRHLNKIFIENIKKIDGDAKFEKFISRMMPTKRLLHFFDNVSSSIIAVEILLSRVIDKHFEKIQEVGAVELRQLQIGSVLTNFDRANPRRMRFLEKYAQKNNIPIKQKEREIKLTFTYLNDYDLQLNDEHFKHFISFQTPEIMRINEHAAFYAAQTGKVLLMLALLGIDFSEQDEQIEDVVENNMFALKEDDFQKQYEQKILEAQIDVVEKYQQQPEHLQDPKELRIELQVVANQIACEITKSLEVWLDARPNAYFRGEKIIFKNCSPAKRDKILNEFMKKLLTKKTDFEIDFDKWQYDLQTILTKLKTQKKSTDESYQHISQDKNDSNMEWCEYQMKRERAFKKQAEIITRILRHKVHKLPDYYPQDEQGLFEYLFAAKVPVNTRNQENNTLLHVAYACGHIGVVRILLLRGAQIEAKNNLDLTPSQYANKDSKELLAIKNQANGLFAKDSNFLRAVEKFEKKYQQHLQNEIKWQQMIIIGRFLNNLLLYRRQQIAQKLNNCINLARIECDDTQLVCYIQSLLNIHYEEKGADTGLLGESMFFAGLEKIIAQVRVNQHDYSFVRLATNLERGMLDLRLEDAEKQENITAKKLKDIEEELQSEKEKHAKDKEQFEKTMLADKIAMEQRQKEHEQKHLKEMKEQEKNMKQEYTTLIKEQDIKHSEEINILRQEFMGMFVAFKNEQSSDKSNASNSSTQKLPGKDEKASLALGASEQGIFSPQTNYTKGC